MYFYDDIKFDINYKNSQYIPSKPVMNFKEFILAYTTIKEDEITKLDEVNLEELALFVFSKIDFSNEKNFEIACAKFIERVNKDVRILMMILLKRLGYSLSEMYEWENTKLQTIFFIECIENKKTKDTFENAINTYFPNNSEEVKQRIKVMFPDALYGITEEAKQKVIEEKNNEQMELIKKLSSL